MTQHLYRAFTLDLAALPPGWFLHALHACVAEIVYNGDTHAPMGRWHCKLQHETGGKLVSCIGSTPEEAFEEAVLQAHVKHREMVDPAHVPVNMVERRKLTGPVTSETVESTHGKVPLRRMTVTKELAATIYGDVIDWQGKTFAPNGSKEIPITKLGREPDAFMYVRDDDMGAAPILTFNRWPFARDGAFGRFREIPLWQTEE